MIHEGGRKPLLAVPRIERAATVGKKGKKKKKKGPGIKDMPGHGN